MIPCVSFILPTYRDYNDYAGKMVESIVNSNYPFDYEIIICSKNEIRQEKITWIKEPDSNNGAVLPINLAYQACKGKYASVLVDDHVLSKDFTNALTFLESSEYDNKKIKITTLLDDNIKRPGDMAYIPGYPCDFFPYQILRFPVTERASAVKCLGPNLLDARFKHHDADMYLSCYLFRKHGELIKSCEQASICSRPNCATNDSSNLVDRSTYSTIHSLPIEQLTYC